ncbi:MAG TPA: HAD family hydrolase [Spirochaetales bacterium]|nr:HAD family hydrolase [Spirochaetales bacterium]
MAIRAVGFDIDGTLYPSSALFLRMLPRAIVSFKLLRAFNAVRRELRLLNPGLPFQNSPPGSIDEFHRLQAGLVARRLGADEEATRDAIKRFFYHQAFEPFDRIRLFPGAKACLEELRSRGFKLGALSDFPCERKLELMGLSSHFDVAMTSEETGLVKPDRAPFDLLAERLGVRNDEVLYVGNSEAYDVRGAKAAGMMTALIARQARKRAASTADFAFSTYAELCPWIASLG